MYPKLNIYLKELQESLRDMETAKTKQHDENRDLKKTNNVSCFVLYII